MFRSLLILGLAASFLSASPPTQFDSSIAHGDLPRVEALIAAGADVNRIDAAGSTPLIVAVLSKQLEIAQYLLAHGAKPNLRQQQNGLTALVYSVADDTDSIVQALLDGGAHLDLSYADGDSILHIAARKSSPPVIEILCRHGADLTAINDHGNTPLDEAVERGRTNIAAALLHWHADILRVHQDDGRGPLHRACIKDYPDLVALLTAAGADPALADRSGQTPLDLALDYQSRHAVVALLHLAPGRSALEANFDVAMQNAVRRGRTTTAALLLDAGWDINHATADHSHYLNDAALQGREKLVRLFLDRGASLTARNPDGGTPLHDAALSGNTAVLNLLLDRGADIDARDSNAGSTPLMLAVALGHTEAVALLLARGANPLLQDRHGRTALSRAREAQSPDLVKLLEHSHLHRPAV